MLGERLPSPPLRLSFIDSAIMGILYFVSLAAVNMGGTDLVGDFLFSLGMVTPTCYSEPLRCYSRN